MVPNDKNHINWRIHDALRDTMSNHIKEYNIKNYITPLINLYKSDNYFEDVFLLRPGDVTFNTFVPIITKNISYPN